MLLMAFVSLIFFQGSQDCLESKEEQQNTPWLGVLKTPGVPISLFTVLFAGIAWSWYSASLEPFMCKTFSSSPSDVGLAYMTFGVTYTVFTPIFGYLIDRGLDGLLDILLLGMVDFIYTILL